MFIAIEGIDGTGKSTQAKRVASYLESTGKSVLLTKEPGGWEGGTELRKLVLSGELTHPWSEAYLFMLDRAEHVSRVINPALADNKIVVCERYHASTLAYQVWGRGLPIEPFDMLFKLSEFPIPDLTILLDIDPEISLKRVSNRGQLDTFENEGLEFMKKIRDGYLAQCERDSKRWIKLNAAVSPDKVFNNIIFELQKRRIV